MLEGVCHTGVHSGARRRKREQAVSGQASEGALYADLIVEAFDRHGDRRRSSTATVG